MLNSGTLYCGKVTKMIKDEFWIDVFKLFITFSNWKGINKNWNNAVNMSIFYNEYL